MKIWCVQLKRILERTDNSPLLHFFCIFVKCHGHLFMKLYLKQQYWKICVHWVLKMFMEQHKIKTAGQCIGFYWHNRVSKVNTLFRQIVLRTKHLNWSNSPWSGVANYHYQGWNWSRHFPFGRSYAQCFGTDKKFTNG